MVQSNYFCYFYMQKLYSSRFYLNWIFDKIQDGCQDGDHVWWRHRPPAAPPSIKYTSSCREKMKGFPLKAKSFRNTAMYQKLKERGGGQSSPLVPRWGMTLRVCPRVNASFHCSDKVIIFNEWKCRSLRWNRRSLLRIMTYCSISVTTIITFIIHSKYFPDSDWLKAHV